MSFDDLAAWTPPHPLDALREAPDPRPLLLENARSLLPWLRAQAAHAEQIRRMPAVTQAALRAAGLWQMLKPRRHGGLEVHPNTFFDVQILVAGACPSTAWVLGVVAVHSWQLALFPPKAQLEVWGDDPEVLIASSYAPTGRVERVEGGYRLSGRWSFSSGCDVCEWVFLGGFAPPGEGQGPDMRTFLVPLAEVAIDDTWFTFALQGTGSKDLVLDGVFVPEHRTHRMSDGFRCESPGNAVHDAPLFRIPFGQLFVRSVSTSSIGIARGALATYLEATRSRVGAADGKQAADDPQAKMAVARATSTLDQLELVLHRNFDAMMAAAARGERIAIEQRVAWRWDSSEAVSRCVEVVDELFSLSGGRALFLDSPMHRYFTAVHGARAHYANRPEASGRNLGGVLLGQRTTDWFV